jgi:hypothetical protein
VVRGEARLAPHPGAVQFPGEAPQAWLRGIRLVVGKHDEALLRGVVAPGAGVVGVAEPVVRDIEELPEHDVNEHQVKFPMQLTTCLLEFPRWSYCQNIEDCAKVQQPRGNNSRAWRPFHISSFRFLFRVFTYLGGLLLV